MTLEVWVSDKLRVPFEREFSQFLQRMAARRESRGKREEKMEKELSIYSFGQRRVEPKPELRTPWDAMRAYDDLQRTMENLQQYAKINGRVDHYVRNLDVLIHSLQEAMFQSMVIREALTGFKSREEAETPSGVPQYEHP